MPWILPNQPQQTPSGAIGTPILVGTASIDPYGVDLAMTAAGDLNLTGTGDLAIVDGPFNCAQAMFLRLNTSRGDLPLHPDYGSLLQTVLVGSKAQLAPVLAEVSTELQTLLANDPRFADAEIVNAQSPATSGSTYGANSAQVSVLATLATGEQVTLESVADPSPSDVSLPQLTDPSIDPTVNEDAITLAEYFADTSELDTLNDINLTQTLVNDLPSSSVTGTGG